MKINVLDKKLFSMISAGEVVEKPASVVKELVENSIDSGANAITVEIKNGGRTFMRVTDNGCGMSPEDARTAFLRHATSKLRTADDLAAISTCGFRGEALAAIASVSRIDLLTKTPGAIAGTSLHLEAGNITDESEAGCPDGTTIIIRDLFYNTPARMKFMKSDSVEGGKVAAAVQMQALAHPEVSFTFIRDGKQTLQTPGSGDLGAAVYCVYGRESAKFVEVSSRWEGYSLRGFVSKPTDARPSRSLQTFFVNDRPVKSRLLIQALEEAYRNQIMVGKFPACVLHLTIPPANVDVNVHPAKTEVKFLSEKAVFDCVHYGVLGALNKTPDRPQVQLKTPPVDSAPVGNAVPGVPPAAQQQVAMPEMEALQEELPMPKEIPWRMVGELYRSYILVEQGDEAFLIDKHAAHERIIFEGLKANMRDKTVDSQLLMLPIEVMLMSDEVGLLDAYRDELERIGFTFTCLRNTVRVDSIPSGIQPAAVPDMFAIFAEQLYRAFTIINNEPYHHN